MIKVYFESVPEELFGGGLLLGITTAQLHASRVLHIWLFAWVLTFERVFEDD